MPYTAITTTQTDAESPLDDQLMDLIRTNFTDHESRILLLKAYPLSFRVDGFLNTLVATKGKYKRLDGSRLLSAQTFNVATMVLDYPGTTGTLEIDLRKYRALSHSIISVISLFSSAISSVSRIGPALSTQSISAATPQISTQSITLFKAAINVSSIIGIGSDLFRYNLASAPDSNYKVNDTVTFAGCTDVANNASFTIVRVNDDGGSNLIITNALGVAQTAAAGTATLRAYSYNFVNPVSAQFVAGDTATMAAHTVAASDGFKEIYAVNSGGNNIIVKDAAGVTQAGIAGNVNVCRWIFSFSAPAPTNDFVVGELAVTSGHTTGANNGTYRITAVNFGGNNVILHYTSGAAQGAAAGTMEARRWVYALADNPTTFFSVGQTAVVAGTTNINNSGNLTVTEINRGGTNNIVVSNPNGLVQAGAAGTLFHSRRVVSFATDLSAFYNTSSNVEIDNCPNTNNNGFFNVVAVNQGGGSNYNVVVENTSGALQSSPAGRIVTESKSIFSTRPKIVFPTSGESSYNNTTLAVQTTAGVIDVTNGVVSSSEVTANVMLGLDIVSFPSGTPKNLTVQIV